MDSKAAQMRDSSRSDQQSGRYFLSASLLLTGARITGAAAGFGAQLLLARLLSAEDLGLFFSATSFATVLALFSARGYPSIAARFIARYEQRGQSGHLQSFIGQARKEAFRTAFLVAALTALGALLYPGIATDTRFALFAAALSIPAMTALTLFGSFAGAVRQFAIGLFPELLLRPAVFLLVVAALSVTATALSAKSAVLILTLITSGLAFVQFRLVSRRVRGVAPNHETRVARRWRREGMPLVVVALFTSCFADLGIAVETLFLDRADLAAFGICLKVSLIIGFVVQIAHQVLLPDVAEAWARRDLADLPRRMLRASWVPLAFTSAATLAAIIWGNHFLGLFGPEFSHAGGVLAVLVGCQLLRALAGPNSYFLTIVGAQHTIAAICVGSCLVLIAASAVLTPSFGLAGAAAAVCITFVFWLTTGALELQRVGQIRCDVIRLAFA